MSAVSSSVHSPSNLKTRILLVSELFPPAVGGSSVLFGNLYSRLEDVQVSILTRCDTLQQADPSGLKSAAIPFPINGRLRGIRSFAEQKHLWSLSWLIRRTALGPTIVHAARPLPEGLAALTSKALLGGPEYACWVHGEDLAVALTSREHSWLARRVCRNASRVICNSKFSSELVRSVGVPEDRIRVVHPGVDTSRFSPVVDGTKERKRLAAGGPILLSVGRLQRRKGHDLTIRAIAEIRHQFPGIRYVIAGDGEERERLIGLAAQLGASENIVFLGAVDDVRLPGLYAASDLFVMPTRQDGRDVEGFGIVYLEAAASGKPSIGGNNGGVPEAIVDGQTGRLVSGTDYRELAAVIERLLSSPEILREMGIAGRTRTCEQFTWDVSAKALEQLHKEMASAQSH